MKFVSASNAYIETEVSPLTSGNGSFMTVDESAEAEQIARLKQWRSARDTAAVCQGHLPISNTRRAAMTI